MKFSMLHVFALVLFGALAAGPATAQTDILFVGNSFTHGNSSPVISYNSAAITDANGSGYGGIPGIFKKLTVQAGLNYNVTIEAVSSQTLSGHFSTKAAIIGQPQWDIVVLQENSTVPLPATHGGNPAGFYSGADNLQNLILASNPAASICLYETWSSPASVTNQSYTGTGTAGLQAMQDDLRDAYFKAFYDYGFNKVARVGDGYMRAVDQGIADYNPADGVTAGMVNLWGSDSRHPSKWGSYLSAVIIFAKVTGFNPTQLTYAGSAAADLGITQTEFTQLNQIAFETNALSDPPATPPPGATTNILKAGTNLNWNAAANWDHAVAANDALLLNSNSAAISQVATSMDGAGHTSSVQTLSFDIGTNTKTVQPNLTTQNPRTATLTGGTDALGGTDLIHLSSTTTGTASIGANTGFSTLTLNLTNSGTFNVQNAAGTLSFGPSSILAGNINLTKTGPGTLVLTGANTLGGTGRTFTVAGGKVFANTPAAGTASATGAGTVVVQTGTTLGGNGQISPGTDSRISVLSGGIIAPGTATPGTLTVNGTNTALDVLSMASGAKFAVRLNNSFQSDRIALINTGATGGITFNNTAIDFTDLSADTLAPGAYTLFTATTAGNYYGLTTDANGIITAGLRIGTGLTAYSASTLQVVGSTIVLNVAVGTTPKPAITSALTAAGMVNTAFSYSITASNTPTSYNATGLPAGLTVNTGTGLITGTPTAAATTNVTIGAANAGGTDTKTLVLTISPAGSDTNQALNKTVTTSTFQTGNDPAKGNDGSGTTRWAAVDGTWPQWWAVDLGASKVLSRVDIDWLNPTTRSYKYKIEGGTDGTTFPTLIKDNTANTVLGATSDPTTANVRYVRITVTGSSSGGFASFYECKVFGH
jgi:autotransporter-associated beta strand protein